MSVCAFMYLWVHFRVDHTGCSGSGYDKNVENDSVNGVYKWGSEKPRINVENDVFLVKSTGLDPSASFWWGNSNIFRIFDFLSFFFCLYSQKFYENCHFSIFLPFWKEKFPSFPFRYCMSINFEGWREMYEWLPHNIFIEVLGQFMRNKLVESGK